MRSIETQGALPGDVTIHVKLRLSSLWVSVMLCYIYGDIFSFFKPGTLKDILAGNMGAFGSQGGLLAAAILMAIPSVMVFLSLALKPRISRHANIVLGLAYTAVIASTIPGAWLFYVFLGVVEAMLTLTIAWYAWRWQACLPRRSPAEGDDALAALIWKLAPRARTRPRPDRVDQAGGWRRRGVSAWRVVVDAMPRAAAGRPAAPPDRPAGSAAPA